MANWDDVRRVALALPETDEQQSRGLRAWRVQGKGFVWERPLRPADLRALGADAPTGPILGARVEHLGAKAALIADDPEVFFTTPHFDGYAAILVRVQRIAIDDLHEVIVEAWLARAPTRLARRYVDTTLRQHAPQNAMDEPGEIARFHDRCSDLMRELLDALSAEPDRPRPFPEIEDAIGWPRRRIAAVLGGVSRLRQREFTGRRPYRIRDTRQSPSGRWEMWMDGEQARALRAARRRG